MFDLLGTQERFLNCPQLIYLGELERQTDAEQ